MPARIASALRVVDGFAVDHVRRARQRSSERGTADDPLSTLLTGLEATSGSRAADRLARDELVTLLFAGHETTADALAWTLYLLARDRAAQDSLASTAPATPGAVGSAAGPHEREPLVRSVLHEALRLYPPVWMIPRMAVHDDTVCGVRVPAGAHVLVSPYCAHRSQASWPASSEAISDRFLRPALLASSPSAYLPFGLGPRSCVGRRMALVEAQAVVTEIVQAFRLRAAPTRLPRWPGLTLQPPRKFRLEIQPRA